MPRSAGQRAVVHVTVAIVACATVGCASTSPRGAIAETSALLEARTGRRVPWDGATPDDAKVAEQVRSLLAGQLTVDAAVEIALLDNPSLQETYEELRVAQADLVQAGLLQNPVFNAGVAFPIAGSAQTGVTLGVSQDFLGVFTLAARKKLAATLRSATELRVADVVLRATYDVESAYYTLVAAEQVAAMRRTILATAEASESLAMRQHEAGDISDLELANEQTRAEEARTSIAKSRVELVVAREALTRWLGVYTVSLEGRVASKLPELPRSEVATGDLEALALGRRLDVKAAREDVFAAERALSLTKGTRWTGGTSVGATYERAPEGFTAVGPSVGLELPIFDQKQAGVARAIARLDVARARERAVRGGATSEVRVAESRAALARDLVERYEKVVVPLRERVVALSQQAYGAMLLGTSQLLIAKAAEVNAYRELIEALRDYWIARADLERATGGSLTTIPTVKEGPPP